MRSLDLSDLKIMSRRVLYLTIRTATNVQTLPETILPETALPETTVYPLKHNTASAFIRSVLHGYDEQVGCPLA